MPSGPSPAPTVELPPTPVEVAGVKPEGGTVFTSKDFTVKVFGRATLDAIYNTARPQAPGNPVFLDPKFPADFRSVPWISTPGIRRSGLPSPDPKIGDFQSGGRIAAVFLDNTNLFADNNGFLLTQAYGELFNDDWRFAAGLQLDVVAPLAPTVLPFAIEGAPIGNYIVGPNAGGAFRARWQRLPIDFAGGVERAAHDRQNSGRQSGRG